MDLKAFKDRRKQLGISVKELSVLTGVHRDTVTRVENGFGDPGFSTVIKLAEALGLEVSFLIKL